MLRTKPDLFFLDLDLPYLVDSDSTGAQFSVSSAVLTITLPVTGRAPL